jgi:hypothetical protein
MSERGELGASEPPERDPAHAAAYLARFGLTLGAVAVAVPAGLGSVVPGPGLSAQLAGLEPGRMHRGQLAQLILARSRLACYELAGLLEAVWEFARAPVVDGGTVVRLDRAYRWVAKELAPLLNWSPYRAGRVLLWARLAVHTAPALLVALRQARLDEDRLAIIASELKVFLDGGADGEEVVRLVVAALLDDLDTHTPRTLAEAIRRELASLDRDVLRRTRERRLAARTVARRDSPGGVSRLAVGACDAAAVSAALEHVDAIAHARRSAGDPRTLDQLRADTALDLLTGVQPAEAGRVDQRRRRGVVNLTVGLSTLAGLDEDHAVLAGYGPVTAAVARQVAAQFAGTCRFRLQLYDDQPGAERTLITEGPLSPADVAALVRHLRRWASDGGRHPVDASAGPDGRAHRDPTAVQKAFVRARDGHCQYPGCRIAARQCDIDHRVSWSDGGTTVVSNLFAVCRGHHRFKHMLGLQYEPALGGLVWNLPNRRRYLTQRQRPPGIRPGRREPEHRFERVSVDLTGYTHTGGPPPHLRQ